MAQQIDRVVDAHIHLWDPARTDWYPRLANMPELAVGDISRWSRLFDQTTYFDEAAGWNVEKVVHVAAARDFVAETLALEDEANATGHPDAIIGGVTPDPVDLAVRQLDTQMAASRFRGIRPMALLETAVPSDDILGALVERNLIFEMMPHTDQLERAASALAGWEELIVVVEHTGWPLSNTDEEFAQWKKGMSALAGLGPHVHCKLSGLAMPLQTMDAGVFRRWIDYSLEVFGVDRCFFASNFPPDSCHGTFDQLYTTFAQLTADLDPEAKERLFAGNAERLYRC